MPKSFIKAPRQVQYLSVLQADGRIDKDLEPVLADDTLLKLHRCMTLSRRFDERMLKLQRAGSIGTFAPIKGQEAAQLGAIAACRSDDWFVPSFRETAAALWRGASPVGILLYAAGYNEGGRIPEGHNDLPIAVPVGTQMLHAVGIAYGLAYREEDSIAMTFFGDGATSEGDFHEALNFAAVLQAPAIFICQNNQWAISVPRERQTRSDTLAEKALAYGMPATQVDGNDLLAVYAAAHEAIERARAGDGPTMIECVTYRMEVHTTADDPKRYRDQDEVDDWTKRDPLPRFESYLKEKSLLDDGKIEALGREIEGEIDEVWKATQSQMEKLGDPLSMFDHMYEALPNRLKAQRQELSGELVGKAENKRRAEKADASEAEISEREDA
jgi:pyruvate dehydrogenase E1 component alpha subunit